MSIVKERRSKLWIGYSLADEVSCLCRRWTLRSVWNSTDLNRLKPSPQDFFCWPQQIFASPRKDPNDFHSWMTISWKRSFRTSGSFSYMMQTLWISPWCWLIRPVNFSSSVAKGRWSLMNRSKVEKDNYRIKKGGELKDEETWKLSAFFLPFFRD